MNSLSRPSLFFLINVLVSTRATLLVYLGWYCVPLRAYRVTTIRQPTFLLHVQPLSITGPLLVYLGWCCVPLRADGVCQKVNVNTIYLKTKFLPYFSILILLHEEVVRFSCLKLKIFTEPLFFRGASHGSKNGLKLFHVPFFLTLFFNTEP